MRNVIPTAKSGRWAIQRNINAGRTLGRVSRWQSRGVERVPEVQGPQLPYVSVLNEADELRPSMRGLEALNALAKRVQVVSLAYHRGCQPGGRFPPLFFSVVLSFLGEGGGRRARVPVIVVSPVSVSPSLPCLFLSNRHPVKATLNSPPSAIDIPSKPR